MAAKNFIIIEPHGGLANRMRVIASGLWLAGILNKKIKLIWNLDNGLNCSFTELFENIENIECIEKNITYKFIRSVENKPNYLKWIILILNILSARKYILFEDSLVKRIRKGEQDIIALASKNKTLYFRTCEEFGSNTDALRLLIPTKEIQRKINTICKQFNHKTIGIHIRRTDHILAKEMSPTELFIKRIYDDLNADPHINYFLASDDKQTVNLFKEHFGDKIVTLDKEYSRNTIQGVKDALTDMFCLANTTEIYGSYWSSFSYISARIAGIKCETLRNEQNA